MKSFNRSLVACAIAAASTTGLSFSAHSQEGGFELEEIIVTANKREQSLQDIPASISAIGGSELKDRGFTDAKDLGKLIPNMITGTDSRGEATLNIRGVGYNAVGSPGVALHTNGVYLPQPSQGSLSQLDISRVEVLRGPQSTLYGRNANAGVVNFITTTPTDEFEGSISLGYAEYDETDISAIINLPLSDSWAARVAVSANQRDEGFYKNIIAGAPDSGAIDKNNGARFSVRGDLSDTVTLNLLAQFTDVESTPYSTHNVLAYGPALVRQPLITDDFEIASNSLGVLTQESSLFSATLDWDLGDWALKSLTALQDYEYDVTGADFDFAPINLVNNDQLIDSETFTQEFNLTGSIGTADTVFGLFYMDDSSNNETVFTFPIGFGPAPAGAQFVILNPEYETESVAVFADATFNVSDNMRIIAGIRYSEDEISVIQNVRFGPQVLCPGLTTELDKSSTIGRLGAQFDLSDNSNLYATYSEGVKTGGVNFRSNCQDDFEDEQITSYEIGYKTRTDDGTLALNLTAFYYDYEDLQTNQIIGFAATIENAPGAEVLGLEMDGAWYPSENFSVTGSVSMLDATYSEPFINVNAAIPSLPSVDVNGNDLNYSPDLSANLSLAYNTGPVIAGGSMDLRFDINYRGEIALREFGLAEDIVDAVTLLGLSAKWLSPEENYSLRFYVDNLSDEAYNEFSNASNQNGAQFSTWNTPRQYGVQFNYEF